MKIAISVPDPLSKAADRAARRLRIPRSQLYSQAVAAFLDGHQRSDVTRQLNAIYGQKGRSPEQLLLDESVELLRRSEWEK